MVGIFLYKFEIVSRLYFIISSYFVFVVSFLAWNIARRIKEEEGGMFHFLTHFEWLFLSDSYLSWKGREVFNTMDGYRYAFLIFFVSGKYGLSFSVVLFWAGVYLLFSNVVVFFSILLVLSLFTSFLDHVFTGRAGC